MSAKACLHKETGDILGSVIAYLAMSLVLAIMPISGIFITF